MPNSTYAEEARALEPAIYSEPWIISPNSRRFSKLKVFFLALLVVTFNSVGNLALAWGLKRYSEMVGWNPLGYLRAMFDPFVATGIVLLVLWMLTRMALMSWADLSFAAPLMAIGYVMATVLGKFVLHESVALSQWMGTLLIFCGIAVVGTTTHRTDMRKLG